MTHINNNKLGCCCDSRSYCVRRTQLQTTLSGIVAVIMNIYLFIQFQTKVYILLMPEVCCRCLISVFCG